ncbi:MAG TPA: PKD domain-containing protein, partial [Bacteroidetes bacterium]|nr:PKD domain-containing protein [Bacteroidota bacterium]
MRNSRTMAFAMRPVAVFLFLIAVFSSSAQQPCDCVTTGNCPVPIQDNGTYNGTLDVTVNGANDLGVNPLTSVCFSITHTWIGDLSVSLTSPAGVNYMLMADVNNNYGGCGMQEDNIEVCIVPGTANPLTPNTEYSCNTGPCTTGTCCLTGTWNVACGGVTDPINGALEAPNCDLNDFNVPGDPANGTWTLTVVDVCNMDTGTLDNFSLTFLNGVESCIVCAADGGTLDSISVTSCYGDSDLLLNVGPNYTGSPPDSTYTYGYIVSQNGVVLSLDSVADLTNQPPGTYHLYGLSYYIPDTAEVTGIIGLDTATVIAQLASTTAPFCGSLSANFIEVTILPTIPVTVLDTMVCEGNCIMVGAQQVCSSTSVTLTSVMGCDSIVDITLTPILPDTVDYTALVCENGCVDIGGNQYCAPGQYYVTLANVLGCDSVINLTFNEITATAVINPAAPPMITCANSSVMLDGSASAGDAYEWTGPNGFTSTQPSITVTAPGSYTLTVYDHSVSPACQASTTVSVGNGLVPPDLIVTGAAPQICEGDNFDLASLTIQDQNNTNPVITFHSATPATPANQLGNTIVSPTTTTTYYILGTKDNCTDETSVILTINQTPTADFTATAAICANDEATVTYTGTAATGATYNWDFDGGVAAPGTGPGPHLVNWATAGTHTISLTVEENGCTSTVFMQDVSVEQPLPTPQVSCSSTTSTITFTWPDVPGSAGYNVNVISSPGGNQGMAGMDPNTYIFENLNEGESVTIEVVALGTGLCGNSTDQASCSAANCPPVVVTIDPVPDICINDSTMPFNLTASATGGFGNGTFVWSGQGITISGNFDPELANIGINTLTVDYYEDNCVYGGNTIDINVHETPLVAIDVPFNICSGAPVPISFAGIADPGSIYTWTFQNGTVVSGSGPGPIEVLWATGGDYEVTLVVESPAGCVSDTLIETVSLYTPLIQPDITCQSTTSGVTFSWTADPNASSYSVNFPGGHLATQLSPTSYEVTNLQPGDVVDIEVEAIGAIPCGNAFFSTSCQVQDCPNVTLTIDPVSDICRTPTTAPFNLTATITGDTPNGTLTWSGTGVDANGLFDPAQANPGPNTVVLSYQEGACFFSESITINVFDTPVADFTADVAAICVGNTATVTYTGTNNANLNYIWDFDGGTPSGTTGPGPHSISWAAGGTYTISLTVENQDGCASAAATTDINVEQPIQQPVINCTVTTSSIVFSWNPVPGVLDSTITVSIPQTGTLQGTTYTLGGLQPGTPVDFQLTLTGAGLCAPVVATASCTTDDCPPVVVDVAGVADMCADNASPLPLPVSVTGSDGTGAGTWSGAGVDANTGQFDPAVAGVGSHAIKYSFTEKGCVFEDSILINIYERPVAGFTTDQTICVADAASVTFNGTANANAVFTWDFDGGTAIPGTGPGPHQVTWDTPGTKTIRLDINNNGCMATQFVQTIQVDAQLATPLINCLATTESVTFTWNSVAGATGYEVLLAGQGTAQAVTDTFFLVEGLAPGEEVVLQLTPIGNSLCPPMPATYTCNANFCSDVLVEVLPVDPICFTPDAQPLILEASVTGTTGTGTGTWSGTGIIDPIGGIFAPLTAGEGIHTVAYNYQLANCSYTTEIEITVAPPPTADAGEDLSLTCWENGSTVRLGGDNTSTGPDVVLQWTTTNGELPDNTSQLRPEVSAPGTYVLTVTDMALGCSSTDEIVVSASQGLPQPAVSFTPSDCSGMNTTVAVESVSGGIGPYLYSLNGEPYVAEDTFAFLPPGIYSLSVIDAMGCESDTTFEIEETQGEVSLELTANLVGRNHIN